MGSRRESHGDLRRPTIEGTLGRHPDTDDGSDNDDDDDTDDAKVQRRNNNNNTQQLANHRQVLKVFTAAACGENRRGCLVLWLLLRFLL